jgi:glycine/D-amino acid oxidase-like deaminating enzyme
MLREIVPDMRPVPVSELNRLFPEKFSFGCFYTTVIVDPRYYLPWMLKEFLKRGQVVVHRVENLATDERLQAFDVVVNCTGFEAKTLVGDHRLVPVRGQTIKVRAPWIKHFYFADGAYVIPASDGIVTLGGIKEYGDSNLRVTPESRESIWKRVTQLVPSLEKAEVLWEWVGLRPLRQPVRVERDSIGGRRVVHNYGHGGNGFSLSYGTALHAAQLVKSSLEKEATGHELRSKL